MKNCGQFKVKLLSNLSTCWFFNGYEQSWFKVIFVVAGICFKRIKQMQLFSKTLGNYFSENWENTVYTKIGKIFNYCLRGNYPPWYFWAQNFINNFYCVLTILPYLIQWYLLYLGTSFSSKCNCWYQGQSIGSKLGQTDVRKTSTNTVLSSVLHDHANVTRGR